MHQMMLALATVAGSSIKLVGDYSMLEHRFILKVDGCNYDRMPKFVEGNANEGKSVFSTPANTASSPVGFESNLLTFELLVTHYITPHTLGAELFKLNGLTILDSGKPFVYYH